MKDFIIALEIFGALWLMVAIFMLGRKNHKWWLFYAFANLPFATVMTYKGLYWFTAMGCILCVSGVRNYYIKKKQAKIEAKREAMSHIR